MICKVVMEFLIDYLHSHNSNNHISYFVMIEVYERKAQFRIEGRCHKMYKNVIWQKSISVLLNDMITDAFSNTSCHFYTHLLPLTFTNFSYIF